MGFLILRTASADVIVPTAGSFQNWTTADLNENGVPFWDTQSLDGGGMNIGYCLTGLGGTCTVPGAPGAIPYLGVGTNPEPNFSFLRTNPVQQAIFKLEITSTTAAALNEFGWYDLTNPGILNPIFLGPQGPGATTLFTPSASYGFYLRVPSDFAVYRTQSSLNPTDPGDQHFAVFRESAVAGSEAYWIAMDDARFSLACCSDRDYNDLVVRVSASSVPEPRSLALFTAGLTGLAAFAGWSRRRRKDVYMEPLQADDVSASHPASAEACS